MKKLLLNGLVSWLAFTGLSAFGQVCIQLNCAPDKTVECGTNWVFDPPTLIDLCGCGTNYTLTILSTTTSASTGPCLVRAEQVWQVADCGGTVSVCTQAVTIKDTTPP